MWGQQRARDAEVHHENVRGRASCAQLRAMERAQRRGAISGGVLEERRGGGLRGGVFEEGDLPDQGKFRVIPS